MKHIFLTGGTGFFGKSILDYRLRTPSFAAEYTFTILSRSPEKFLMDWPSLANQPGVSFVKGDVRDLSALTESYKRSHGQYDAIIHAATSAITTISDCEQTSVIINGTRSVIDFAQQTNTTKVLFTSSGAVYGKLDKPATEDTPTCPVTAYGKGKLEAEQMLLSSGLDVKIARCFAFTGPYLNRDIHFAIGNFIGDALAGRDILIKGDGSPLRSYLYADDLVEWLFAILERGENGRPYNLGSDEAISIRDLASRVTTVLASTSHVTTLGKNITGASSVYLPDISRIQSELGVKIKVNLNAAITASVKEFTPKASFSVNHIIQPVMPCISLL